MSRNLIRSKNKCVFYPGQPELENFNANGGEPPQCSITLCFGEELSTTDDLASKLVIVQVSCPTPPLSTPAMALRSPLTAGPFSWPLTGSWLSPQVTLPWAEQQVQKVISIQDSISLLRSLASQSPLGEITLNLVPLPADSTNVCGSA